MPISDEKAEVLQRPNDVYFGLTYIWRFLHWFLNAASLVRSSACYLSEVEVH